MIKEDLTEQLEKLSTKQLNDLLDRTKQEAAKIEQQSLQRQINTHNRTSPAKSRQSKVEQMADDLGLDLSGLMREISRR